MTNKSQAIFTGGSGLLGSEFRKILPNINYPSSKEFNVTKYNQMKKYLESNGCELIFHAAAFTPPPLINKDPLKALETNIVGTSNVMKLCMEFDARLIYIMAKRAGLLRPPMRCKCGNYIKITKCFCSTGNRFSRH